MSEIVAIIPARGGSKGIPLKNLYPLAGKPLILYSIEQARACERVSRVIVSTDSDRIADVAALAGAEIVRRPDELSGDDATSESALVHCLDHLRGREGDEPALVVFLQATSPLRAPADIDAAVDTVEADGADSLFSACRQHAFVWRRANEELTPLNYDPSTRPRRQDAPEDLAENGSIYVFRPWVLRETGARLGGRVSVYLMNQGDSFQLDESDDIPILECALRARHPDQVGDTRDR